MEVTLLDTVGVNHAMRGGRLSRKSGHKLDSTFRAFGPQDQALARKLVAAGDEHAKFARMIPTWMIVKATRGWWQEMATYRFIIWDDAEWNSESTMHTLLDTLQHERDTLHEHFSGNVLPESIGALASLCDQGASLDVIKDNLPEGFLQARLCMTNVQALRRIYAQRHNHKLQEWHDFCRQILEQYPFPYLITGEHHNV